MFFLSNFLQNSTLLVLKKGMNYIPSVDISDYSGTQLHFEYFTNRTIMTSMCKE